jgi:hypothetical protein
MATATPSAAAPARPKRLRVTVRIQRSFASVRPPCVYAPGNRVEAARKAQAAPTPHPTKDDSMDHPRARVAINYMEAVAENLMKLECPPGQHHPAICPRCQASMQLAKALTALDDVVPASA